MNGAGWDSDPSVPFCDWPEQERWCASLNGLRGVNLPSLTAVNDHSWPVEDGSTIDRLDEPARHPRTCRKGPLVLLHGCPLTRTNKEQNSWGREALALRSQSSTAMVQGCVSCRSALAAGDGRAGLSTRVRRRRRLHRRHPHRDSFHPEAQPLSR